MTYKTACIVSLNGAISESDYSHRAHWPKLRRLQLLEAGWAETIDLQPAIHDLHDYDAVIFYWGIEWNDALNLYGGASNDNAVKLGWIGALEKKAKAKQVFCLDMAMPDIGTLANSRGKVEELWAAMKWDKIDKVCAMIPMLAQASDAPHHVIGDSHASSLYREKTFVSRNDFKTLHGLLAAPGGLRQLVQGRPKEITWYLGSIDLRHHLARQPAPEAAIKELIQAYLDQVEEIRRERGSTMAIVMPLPIEPETRKIPQTGFFKGTPFFGLWANRNDLRGIFRRELLAGSGRYGFTVIDWPEWFKDETGAMREELMEKPQSVHLAWKYRWQELLAHQGREY